VTAESCTAGEIASSLAGVPGSGPCFDVGFVTYSPTGKAGFLGVRNETMDEYGLTSEPVAREMTEGALQQEACSADVAVSSTGVADEVPSGGPPAGTQCFAWSYRMLDGRLGTFSETRLFNGAHVAALRCVSRLRIGLRELLEVRAARGFLQQRLRLLLRFLAPSNGLDVALRRVQRRRHD
jgi:nicotinamide-nucleotide amidase